MPVSSRYVLPGKDHCVPSVGGGGESCQVLFLVCFFVNKY